MFVYIIFCLDPAGRHDMLWHCHPAAATCLLCILTACHVALLTKGCSACAAEDHICGAKPRLAPTHPAADPESGMQQPAEQGVLQKSDHTSSPTSVLYADHRSQETPVPTSAAAGPQQGQGSDDDDESSVPSLVGSPPQLFGRMSNTAAQAAAARGHCSSSSALLPQGAAAEQPSQESAEEESFAEPMQERRRSVTFAPEDEVWRFQADAHARAPDQATRNPSVQVPSSRFVWAASDFATAPARQPRPQPQQAPPPSDNAAYLGEFESRGSFDFSELLEALQPRRSVDVRMADAATLHMVRALCRPLHCTHHHYAHPGAHST